ncbi:hypothetical protein [Nitratireductor sp. ZSWI3]|uniref:hypothetical protein n=1 Tax=Nitratireductor sp. ZSWI3 TaxID=2966359 RepID=UPI00214FCCE8|nr:hypothetical protein [Nitratireductor sp. ZSWI3]MCR4265153.1 hypothetical protein [Nitratireductor sp. ZSWI3]
MTGTVAKDDLIRSRRSKAETKAETTDQAARAIIEAETERRQAKSKRLRQARLEREARQATEPNPIKPKARRKGREESAPPGS